MRWASVALCLLFVPAAACGEGGVRGFAMAGWTCWAVGDAGLVLRSDDGGKNWQRQQLDGVPDREMLCLSSGHFHGAATAEATGAGAPAGELCVFGGLVVPGHPGGASVGAILHSGDGGKTWRLARPAGVAHLHGGRIDGKRGVVFGRPTRSCPSGLWMTVTRGKIWNPVRTASAGAVLGGDFLGVDEACLVGPANRIVSLRSLGEPRDRPPAIASAAALNACGYADEDRCWAAGENGSVFLVVRGGEPPRPVALPLPGRTRRLADLEAVAAAGKGVWLAGGLIGKVLFAGDGGSKLQPLPAPGPGPVHALACLSEQVLLAGGDGGRIWRSDDAGKSWRLVHGPDGVDVLFIAGPADVSILPAAVAHAQAGAETAIVFAAMPDLPAYGSPGGRLRGDIFCKFAASAAGAGGAIVLGDFPSVAGDPDAAKLDEDAILKRWSAALDVSAREEMLRQLAAAVRLYRPKVVALGPDGYEAAGAAAESHLISRLAAEATRLAGDEAALPELAGAGLKPWKVARVYTALAGNDRYVPPWSRRAAGPRQNVAARFVGWRYPAGRPTSLSMLAMRAGWLLPWVAPLDRPAAVTAYRCSEILPARPLFTSGLTAARLSMQAEAPIGDALAAGSTLRAAALLRQNAATASGPLLAAAKAHASDPLPADLLGLLFARMLEAGRLSQAGEIQLSLLACGGAHPLFQRHNVAAVAMGVSAEWRQQAAVTGPESPWPAPARVADVPVRIRLPGREDLKSVVARLEKWPWRAWVDNEPGLALLAKAHARLGDYESARVAYRQLARAGELDWARFAKAELTTLTDPLAALVEAGGFAAPATAQTLRCDARLEEPFWRSAKRFVLAPVGGRPAPAVRVYMAATPVELAIAVQLSRPAAPTDRPATTRQGHPSIFEPPAPPPPAAPVWELAVAIDADRDVWTQLLLRCDSTGRRELRLLTHLAPEATLPVGGMPVQAREDRGSWTIELSVPRRLIQLGPGEGGLIRMQLVLKTGAGGGQSRAFYLIPQAEGRLLPHRYALLAVPPRPPGYEDADRR